LGSELAINITDGKLFYKDNANAVQVIAWKVTPTTAGGTGLTTYTAGDLVYYASGSTFTKLAIGASGRYLSSTGSAPQWSAPGALTKVDDTNVTLTLGGSPTTALLNAASITVGWSGTLATTRGGTGLSSFTANGVVYASSTSALATSANLAYNGTNLTLTGGNVIIGTSGKGIDFSATPGTGTSELFADYEEGTWTPTITGSSTNPTVTYGLQRAIYTKVGRVVTVSCFLSWSAISGGSGDIRISGLPFTIESSIGAGGAGAISELDGFTFAALRTSASMSTPSNTTFLNVRCFGSGVSTVSIAIADLAASGSLIFTATYAV
jgi:hypothetical protein